MLPDRPTTSANRPFGWSERRYITRQAHYVTQQAKGLKGRLGVLMNLGGSHIERPKDAHRELIKGKRHMEV